MISFILFLMCLMLMTLTALSLAGMLFTLLSGGDPDRMAELGALHPRPS